MIHVNEIMYGDFFRVNRDVCIKKDTIVQIRGIDGDTKLEEKRLVGCAQCHPLDKYQYDGGIWLEFLDPIPLTIDMLLHSGFELQEQGGERFDLWTGFGEDNQHDIEVEFQDDKPIHLKIDGPVYLATTHIEYVHQLQHFLRDCKTGKEIEL